MNALQWISNHMERGPQCPPCNNLTHTHTTAYAVYPTRAIAPEFASLRFPLIYRISVGGKIRTGITVLTVLTRALLLLSYDDAAIRTLVAAGGSDYVLLRSGTGKGHQISNTAQSSPCSYGGSCQYWSQWPWQTEAEVQWRRMGHFACSLHSERRQATISL